MKNGLRVGLVGICTGKLMRWEKREILDELEIRDPVECARRELARLKGRTDLNICIYHGGFEFDPATGRRITQGTENQGEAVCALGFDLVLCAHQHRSMPGLRMGTAWAVQVPNRGREYNRVDITVGPSGPEIRSRAVRPDTEMFEAGRVALQGTEDRVQRYLDSPIGQFSQPLEAAPPLVSAFRGSAIANFINRVHAEAAGTRIAACSLQNEQRGFPREVTIREILTTYRFQNTLVVLRLSGREIREYLEQCARYFTLTEKGEVRVNDAYLYPKPHHYHYDYLYGLEYEVDLKKAPGSRVGRIRRSQDGSLIGEDDLEEICFNSYRATGIGGYDMLRGKQVIREVEGYVADLMIEYLKRHGHVEADQQNAVSFIGHEGLFISPSPGR